MRSAKPFRLSVPAARAILKGVTEGKEALRITDHAAERMEQREVSRDDILAAFVLGVVTEGPSMTPHGDWKLTVERRATGLQVSVAIELPSTAVIVTVI